LAAVRVRHEKGAISTEADEGNDRRWTHEGSPRQKFENFVKMVGMVDIKERLDAERKMESLKEKLKAERKAINTEIEVRLTH